MSAQPDQPEEVVADTAEHSLSGARASFPQALGMLWRVMLLWRIWFTLGRRDFAMRFRRMRLGVAWQFITLTLLLLAIGVIYATLFKTEIRSFLVFLSASLILWFFLTQTMDMGCGALIGSEGYIKQLPVPPLTYALRAATASTLSFVITMPAFFVVKLIFQPVFWWWMLWALPGLVCFMVAVTLISASLAYLNARFRDVQPAVSAFMQIMFYVTPMIYMPEQLGDGHAFVYLYNPIFHLINIVRGPLLGHTNTLAMSWAVSGLVVVALMMVLLLVIHRYDRRVVYYL